MYWLAAELDAPQGDVEALRSLVEKVPRLMNAVWPGRSSGERKGVDAGQAMARVQARLFDKPGPVTFLLPAPDKSSAT